MLLIACPLCGDAVTSQELPSRLPLVVPEHRMDGHHCGGSGSASSRAWMARPEELRRAAADLSAQQQAAR